MPLRKLANRDLDQIFFGFSLIRSEAQQRAGRAGRTSPGKCFRIYNKEFWEKSMPEYTVPEIQRTSLTAVILTLKCLGVHDVIRSVCTLIVHDVFMLHLSFFSNELISFKVPLSGLSRGKVYSRGVKTALPVWCHRQVSGYTCGLESSFWLSKQWSLCSSQGSFMSSYLSGVWAVGEAEWPNWGSWWWSSPCTRASPGPCSKPPRSAVRTCCSPWLPCCL